jgi:hypothetical protein
LASSRGNQLLDEIFLVDLSVDLLNSSMHHYS